MRKLRKPLLIALGVILGLGLTLTILGYAFRKDLVVKALKEFNQSLASERIYLDYTIEEVTEDNGIHLRLKDITAWQTDQRKTPAATLTGLDLTVFIGDSIKNRTLVLTGQAREETLTLHGGGNSPAFEKLSLDLSLADKLLTVKNITSTFQNILIKGTAHYEMPIIATENGGTEETPSARMPTVLPFAALAEAASSIDYRNSGFTPKIEFNLKGIRRENIVWPDPNERKELEVMERTELNDSTLRVVFQTTDFPSRNVELEGDFNILDLKKKGVSLINLFFQYPESPEEEKEYWQSVEVGGTYKHGERRIEDFNLSSTFDWFVALEDLPAVASLREHWQGYRFKKPPSFHVYNADLDLNAPTKSLVKTERESIPGFSVIAHRLVVPSPNNGGSPLEFSNLNIEGDMEQGTVSFSEFAAIGRGFVILAEGSIRPFEPLFPWELELTEDDKIGRKSYFTLESLTKFLGEAPQNGELQFTFQGSGTTAVEAFNGKGKVKLTEAKLSTLPVLGPILDEICKTSAPAGESNEDSLHSTFTIDEGVISAKDLGVEVSSAALKLNGKFDLSKQSTQFEGTAILRENAGRPPKEGGPLRIEAEGPFSDVKWRVVKSGEVNN